MKLCFSAVDLLTQRLCQKHLSCRRVQPWHSYAFLTTKTRRLAIDMIITSPKNVQDAEKQMVPASSFLKPSYKNHRNKGVNFKQTNCSEPDLHHRNTRSIPGPDSAGVPPWFAGFFAIFRNLRWISSMGIIGDSESTKYEKNTKSVSAIVNLQRIIVFSRWENTTSAETERIWFWFSKFSDHPKAPHFFSHTAICRPLRLSPLLPLALPPNCQSSANCPVTTPSWGKHVSTYPPLVPWNDPLAILLYGLTSNHSFSRPYSCRVPLGDQQFYLRCHSTSARVALLSTSLHLGEQVCYKEANIQRCHRNLLAHKDCAYSNQGPKYNPGRIRLRRFSLGLPVWQPHLRWFAPHVLAQFSSSPLLVRQTIGWPIGDLPVQLAGPHAGQGRKALWRNLCLPHSIFQYISYLSWLRTKKSLLTVSSPTKRKHLTSPFHRLRFTGTVPVFAKGFVWKA